MTDFATRVREEARLIILRTLAGEASASSNSSLLQSALEGWGISKSREWVHAELRQLADVGAVTAEAQGSVLLVTLTQRGLDHVDRKIALDGVKRPSLPIA